MTSSDYEFCGFESRGGHLVARFAAPGDIRFVAPDGVYVPQSSAEELTPHLHEALSRRARELLAALRTSDVAHAHDAARRRPPRSLEGWRR